MYFTKQVPMVALEGAHVRNLAPKECVCVQSLAWIGTTVAEIWQGQKCDVTDGQTASGASHSNLRPDGRKR